MTATQSEVRYVNTSLDYADVWADLETVAPKKVENSRVQYNHENDTDDLMPEFSDGMNEMAQATLVRGGFSNERPNPDA